MGVFDKNLGWLGTPARKFYATVFVQVLVTAAAVASATRLFFVSPPQAFIAFVIVLCTSISAVVGFFLTRQKYQEDHSKQDPEIIVGILTALYHTLIGIGKVSDHHGLRICLHVKEDNHWVQLVDYIGHSPNRGKGRRDENSKGIVGAAIRSGKVAFAKLPANTQFVDFVVNKFGYSRDEAANLKSDCKSWIAVPIGLKGNIVAVIFCDSTDPNFFGKAAGFRRKVLETVVLGIAEYAERR